MYRVIKTSEETTDVDNLKMQFMQLLHDHGIDTINQKYELFAEAYERFGSGHKYRKTFTCPSDYIAYFSMVLHKKPTFNDIYEHFDEDIDYATEFIEDNPNVESIKDYAFSSWWGDGDDYIIYLKNLTIGKIFYESYYEEEPEYEDDNEDF